jgi:hypothetical protein
MMLVGAVAHEHVLAWLPYGSVFSPRWCERRHQLTVLGGAFYGAFELSNLVRSFPAAQVLCSGRQTWLAYRILSRGAG